MEILIAILWKGLGYFNPLKPVFDGIVKALKGIKVALDGVALVGLVVLVVVGGFLWGRHTRHVAIANIAHQREVARAAVVKQVRAVVADRRGVLTAAEKDRDGINREIKAIVDQIPVETFVPVEKPEPEPRIVERYIPGPTVTRTKVVVRKQVAECDLPSALTSLVNKINVGASP